MSHEMKTNKMVKTEIKQDGPIKWGKKNIKSCRK